MFHASNMQREEMRGGVSGDTVFDFCYRSMYQKDLPKTDSPSMGSQDLANFILWLIEDNQLPNDLVSPIQEGAQEELAARHKTLQTDKDQEEMWVRWIKQRIHGELDSLRTALDLPEELDVFSSIPEGEQKPYSAEIELEAQRLQASLGARPKGCQPSESVPRCFKSSGMKRMERRVTMRHMRDALNCLYIKYRMGGHVPRATRDSVFIRFLFMGIE